VLEQVMHLYCTTNKFGPKWIPSSIPISLKSSIENEFEKMSRKRVTSFSNPSAAGRVEPPRGE